MAAMASSPPGLAPAASPGQPISSPTSPTWRPRHDTPSFSLARLTARRHRPRPSAQPVADHGRAGIGAVGRLRPDERSEEHTSELQSLMRISYAVFCLKKKKHIATKHVKNT